MVSTILKFSLNNWVNIDKDGIESLENIPDRYNQFKIIQNTLAHCYFDKPNAENKFRQILDDQKVDFSRYNFFFVNYLLKKNNLSKAKQIAKLASKNIQEIFL